LTSRRSDRNLIATHPAGDQEGATMSDTARDDRDVDPIEEPVHLQTGMTVVVRNRFDGAWADGFEIARSDHGHGPFQLRRCSDHSVLPAEFSADDVRPA
jgi:hypothetical protein